MNLEPGSIVVYPVHGVAEVVGVEARSVDGEVTACVVLKIRGQLPHGNLTVRVPERRIADLGVRETMSIDEATDVLEVLAERNIHLPSNWSRRFKNHQMKLRSGEVLSCAEVVRNLTLRDRQRPLSSAEKVMYRQARSGLVAELAVTWDVTVETATERIDVALQP